jgi:3-ketosteroid 9alpha-monooxygenase subunit A
MLTEMASVLPNILLLAHTPIDAGSLHLRFGAMIKTGDVGARGEEFAATYKDNLLIGFKEDIAIWENKLYRERPTLCDGDGNIGGLRRWYQHFYEPRSNQAAE